MNICNNAEKCKLACVHKLTHPENAHCQLPCGFSNGILGSKCREVPIEVLTSENGWLVTRKDFGKLLAESGSIIAEALKKIGINITDYYNIIPGPGLRRTISELTDEYVHKKDMFRFIEQTARSAVRELLEEVLDEVMCRKDD